VGELRSFPELNKYYANKLRRSRGGRNRSREAEQSILKVSLFLGRVKEKEKEKEKKEKMVYDRDKRDLPTRAAQKGADAVDSGHARLNELGYKQELKRDLS